MLHLPVSSLFEFTSCFIFIALPFSNVNPGAFPEEVKSEQTAIKLIEAARYQLRCSRPWQHILRWPCRTLARCYLSKFNSWPAATDPTAATLSLSELLWLKHSLRHSQAWLPCWWKCPAEGQAPAPRIGRTRAIFWSPSVFIPLLHQLPL